MGVVHVVVKESHGFIHQHFLGLDEHLFSFGSVASGKGVGAVDQLVELGIVIVTQVKVNLILRVEHAVEESVR